MTNVSRPNHVRRVLLIVAGSVVGVLALAVGSVLAVGGLFVPATYLEPWSKTYPAQFEDPRMQLVAQGVLAPSGHNMQPWLIELDASDPDVFYLYADASRLSLVVDPLSRQVMVSQGTFLQYLRTAGEKLGYGTDFELFPEGGYDETDLVASMGSLPVAKITMTSTAATDVDYDSLYLSDTNRSPYSEVAVTLAQTAELEGLASESGVTLKFYEDPTDIATFRDFGIEGTLIETKNVEATAETNAVFFASESAKNDARYGFAVEGQGTSGFMKYLLQGLITLFPGTNDDAIGAERSIASTLAAVNATPAYALITTEGNSRVEQVEAGILYAQLSLRARTLGLVMQPLSQVIQEYPTMAVPYAAVHDQYAPDGGTIQMLVRVGTATTDYPPTMRRDASALLR